MKIGFITPSLHTLSSRWREDPQIVKLAVPTLSGYLHERGYTDIRQYDFELQLADLERSAPGAIDLRHYFDDTAVDRFLGGSDAELGPELERMLAALEVEPAELFGLSCASALGRYAEMHATGNLCLCLARALKRRWPGCVTVLGGLQLSPESQQHAEYLAYLVRTDALDYAVGGSAGEAALHAIVQHVAAGPERELAWPGVRRHGHGAYLPKPTGKTLRVPPAIARDEGIPLLRGFVTPDEPPLGSHERHAASGASVDVTPWFDPRNVARRAVSGRQLAQRYHLGPSALALLGPALDERLVVLPLIFLEGCNAECAFCGYSMSRLVRRDIGATVRAIAWLRDTYGARHFHFLNTNINASLKYAEAFCDALIAADLGILWSDCANLWAVHPRLLDKLVRSGCVRLTWGIECPSDRMLAYLRKGISVAQAEERLRLAHEAGLWNQALLITGLPTETAQDVQSFVAFLERTAPYLDGYSISPFYLISSSLMGTFPHRFGLELCDNPTGLLEDAAFREVGGLDWPAKQRQIAESTRTITDTVRQLKPDPKTYGGSMDLELLFWLYRALGHARKAEIARVYQEAYLVSRPEPHPRGSAARVPGDTPSQARCGVGAGEAGGRSRHEPGGTHGKILLGLRCNNACVFCYNRHERDGADMLDEPRARRLVDEAAATGCRELNLIGGEVTVLPYFLALIEHAARRFAHVSVNTNGRRFADAAFAAAAVRAGLTHVDVSVHGAGAEVHDRVCGVPGAFAETWAGLEALARLARAEPRLRLSVTTVLLRDNLDELDALGRKLGPLGVGAWRLKQAHGALGARTPPSDEGYIPRYSELGPKLRSLVQSLGEPPRIVIHDVPQCVLGELGRLSTDFDQHEVALFRGEGLHTRRTVVGHWGDASPRCAGCALGPSCCKPSPAYVRLYGDGELAPVSEPIVKTQKEQEGEKARRSEEDFLELVPVFPSSRLRVNSDPSASAFVGQLEREGARADALRPDYRPLDAAARAGDWRRTRRQALGLLACFPAEREAARLRDLAEVHLLADAAAEAERAGASRRARSLRRLLDRRQADLARARGDSGRPLPRPAGADSSLPRRPDSPIPGSLSNERPTIPMVDRLIEEKLQQVPGILKELGLDAWLLFARESHAVHDPSFDLVVGTGVTWQSAFVLTARGERVALVGSLDRANIEAHGLYPEMIGYVGGINDDLRKLLARLDPGRIAINFSKNDPMADGMTYGMYLLLMEALADTPYASRLESAERVVTSLRGRKSPTERDRIAAACRDTLDIYQRITPRLHVGQTEKQVAAMIVEEMDRIGGLERAWDPEHCPAVFTGPESAGAHAGPTDRRIEAGHILNTDFGVRKDGFCSDLQRTWYFLRPGEERAPVEVERGFRTIVEAIQRAAQALRPGVKGGDIDAIARGHITAQGYAEFPHGLGHQVGREAHDGAGLLCPRWERYGSLPELAVERGQVYTLEPRLDVKGHGVATIEEIVVVEQDGCTYLSAPQTELYLVAPAPGA